MDSVLLPRRRAGLSRARVPRRQRYLLRSTRRLGADSFAAVGRSGGTETCGGLGCAVLRAGRLRDACGIHLWTHETVLVSLPKAIDHLQLGLRGATEKRAWCTSSVATFPPTRLATISLWSGRTGN